MRFSWPVIVRAIVRSSFVASLLTFLIPLVAFATTYSSDVATSGQAISGGDNASFPKGQAFDDSAANGWIASQAAGTCATTPAYIGQDFGSGVAYEIRRFSIQQTSGRTVTSVVVRWSDNGSTWNTAETVTLAADTSVHIHDIGSYGGHRYWKLDCNATPAASWGVTEIEMFYILTDTPTPTLTPTITATPSSTPTPTATNTPDYFVVATFATLNYPMTVRPTATYGELGITGAVFGLLSAFGIIATLWLLRQR